MRTTYPDTQAGATQCLADDTIEAVTILAAERVQDGSAAWLPDPEVAGVWALVRSAEPNRALVVVY